MSWSHDRETSFIEIERDLDCGWVKVDAYIDRPLKSANHEFRCSMAKEIKIALNLADLNKLTYAGPLIFDPAPAWTEVFFEKIAQVYAAGPFAIQGVQFDKEVFFEAMQAAIASVIPETSVTSMSETL